MEKKITTGEKRKMRCYYLNNDGTKAVSRVIEVEKLQHEALEKAGLTAWLERKFDDLNQPYGLVHFQLTETICQRPNATGCDGSDLKVMDGCIEEVCAEQFRETYRRNVERFFERIAKIPAAQLNGEYYPNMAVIEAYKAAGMTEEAAKLADFREREIERRKAAAEASRKEQEERERKEKEEKAAATAKKIADEENSLRTKGEITGWGVVQLCDRYGIAIHLRTRHNLLEVVDAFINNGNSIRYKSMRGKRKPSFDGCFSTMEALKERLCIA